MGNSCDIMGSMMSWYLLCGVVIGFWCGCGFVENWLMLLSKNNPIIITTPVYFVPKALITLHCSQIP